MAKVRQSHLRALRPYLIGERAKSNGEWDMYCPLHEDANRSASINVETGVWFCQKGCGGGRVSQLIAQRENWLDPARHRNGHTPHNGTNSNDEPAPITEAQVQGWHAALTGQRLEDIMDARLLDLGTIQHYEIGWDSAQGAYTIPIRDVDGKLINVRRYQLNPAEGRRKIWSHGKGYGAPRLFPIEIFGENPEAIIVCEGEWDAIVTRQNGYPAVTRTGAAKVWDAGWGEFFRDKVVYLAHDCDKAGQDGNRIVGRSLQRVAREVRVLALPYPIETKHGKDLTDFWYEHGTEDFERLLREAHKFGVQDDEPEDADPSDASVIESMDARRVGKPLRLTVTVKGVHGRGYAVPAHVRYECTRDAGQKCNLCPMNAAGGEDELEIDSSDPTVLELIDSNKEQLREALRERYGALPCNKLQVTPITHQSVEILFARPSVDHVRDGNHAADYKNIKITHVGKHDTQPNNTVQVVGALYPDPRHQTNEFLAWDLRPMETSLDAFNMDKRTIALMKRFQPRPGQRPLRKAKLIANDLAAHVTRIYGRPEMHILMDLVWHSVLAFDFSGQHIARGWLEALILGDTRTGKSETAASLISHYQAGELVSCEAASFAGVIGGLQQFGSGKEWAVSWGLVPINDRRLVVLDEVSGLTHDEISQMSDVRSSGVAQLQKIQQERAMARTRLLWTGNPRSGRMSNYTYGVQGIAPLIGNQEDIARFDLAMTVYEDEVPPAEINQPHEAGRFRYTAAASRALVRWVWSRRPEHIVWARGAEKAVYKAAQDLGSRYVPDPPLIQAANVRIKVARIAVALAARTFSTDKTYQQVVVKREHVEDAVTFVDMLYGMPNFGYAEHSRELLSDRKEAHRRRDDVKGYLVSRPELAKFLRGRSHFRRQDLEEVLATSRDEANAIINKLWGTRMVRKEGADVRLEPPLQTLLREVKS